MGIERSITVAALISGISTLRFAFYTLRLPIDIFVGDLADLASCGSVLAGGRIEIVLDVDDLGINGAAFLLEEEFAGK